jgi:hypothetical protein
MRPASLERCSGSSDDERQVVLSFWIADRITIRKFSERGDLRGVVFRVVDDRGAECDFAAFVC